VGGSVGGLQVFVNNFKLSRAFVDGVNIAIEFLIVRVKLVICLFCISNQRGGHLNFGKGLKHLNLLFDLDLRIENKIRHMTEAKVVRDDSVEFTGKGLYI
jgi:hypothetical protein